MPVNSFLYGLSAFAMSLIVLLRGRRNSQIALGQEFYWLGAFGLLTSFYAWGEMFHVSNSDPLPMDITAALLTVLLIASGITLVRFSLGLILNSGLLPAWFQLFPVAIIVPIMLLVSYAIVTVATAANHEMSAAQWTRYLLLFPGNIFAAFGFALQWRRLKQAGTAGTPNALIAAAVAFLLNAFCTGAVTGSVGLSDGMIESLTQVPIAIWRTGAMVFVALLVSDSMNIFEVERRQQIERLESARKEAQNATRIVRTKTRHDSEIWLDALVKVSHRIANMDDADAVLCDVVALARKLVQAETTTLALCEPGSRLSFKCQATEDGVSVLEAAPVENTFICRAAEAGLSRRYPEDVNGAAFTWEIGQMCYQAKVAAIVPLQLNQTLVGVLWAARTEQRSFSCTDLIGLSHLANQAVIVLEHASMAGQLQSLAVLQERSRIAREMHDSLAQILGYLSLEMQTLEALTCQHDEKAVLTELAQARATIKSAQADVRENILSLRTTLAQGVGFIPALAEYVEEFGIQTGIQAAIRGAETVTLSPLAEAQAVRIIQEALTNVRKHAQATNVCVALATSSEWLTISIADNGVGLQRQAAPQHHFGLQTMRERAESVGGALRIDSGANTGTTVELRLPLM